VDTDSLVLHVEIFAWIVLYGVSIAIAAAQDQEAQINWKALKEDGIKAWNPGPHCSKIHWKSILPYFIVVLLKVFSHYHSLLETVLWVLVFWVLTWLLVFCVRKQ
jgi:hypothetical protein